jgi:SH3-like domain-containing protein
MRRELKTKRKNRAMWITAFAIAGVCAGYQRLSYAQFDESGGLDEPPVALGARNSARANPQLDSQYPDNFRAAEQALMVGLARKADPAKAENSFPSPTQVRGAIEPQPSAPRQMIRRIKSTDVPDVLDSIPQVQEEAVPVEINDDLDSLPPAKPANFTQPIENSKASAKPAAPAKKAAPPREKTSVLQDKLLASEQRARDLERQLREAKSQLAAAELEISRLSSIAQNNSRARLNPSSNDGLSNLQVSSTSTTPSKIAPPRPAPPVAEKISDHVQDLQVATISVEKADLRLGPGKNHSALMTLRQGSRLVIEARQGEWYRVFAPNGQRAWIHSSLVRFGAGSESLNDGSSVRMRGFDGTLR